MDEDEHKEGIGSRTVSVVDIERMVREGKAKQIYPNHDVRMRTYTQLANASSTSMAGFVELVDRTDGEGYFCLRARIQVA